jgi:hypothetical protein
VLELERASKKLAPVDDAAVLVAVFVVVRPGTLREEDDGPRLWLADVGIVVSSPIKLSVLGAEGIEIFGRGGSAVLLQLRNFYSDSC